MHRLRLYGLLVGLMITILLICDTLAFKLISIDGHELAASGVIFPLSFLIASIITEVYGYNLSGRIIWIQLFCQAIFILMINIFAYIPSTENTQTGIYYLLLYSRFWHVLLAASFAVTAAYFINDFIMSKLKIYMAGKYFFIRFLLSNAVGKAILVSISYPINFYNLYSWHHIFIIALNTWAYKIIMALILLPVAIFLSNIIKRIEKLDYYDYGVSYNPILVFNSNPSGRNQYEHEQDEWKYIKNYTN